MDMSSHARTHTHTATAYWHLLRVTGRGGNLWLDHKLHFEWVKEERVALVPREDFVWGRHCESQLDSLWLLTVAWERTQAKLNEIIIVASEHKLATSLAAAIDSHTVPYSTLTTVTFVTPCQSEFVMGVHSHFVLFGPVLGQQRACNCVLLVWHNKQPDSVSVVLPETTKPVSMVFDRKRCFVMSSIYVFLYAQQPLCGKINETQYYKLIDSIRARVQVKSNIAIITLWDIFPVCLCWWEHKVTNHLHVNDWWSCRYSVGAWWWWLIVPIRPIEMLQAKCQNARLTICFDWLTSGCGRDMSTNKKQERNEIWYSRLTSIDTKRGLYF